jgi:hypothetical protein
MVLIFPVHIDATMGLVIPRRGPVVSIFSAYVIIILILIILLIIIVIQRTEYLILILFINISIDCKIRQVFKVLMYFPEITRQNVSNTTIFALFTRFLIVSQFVRTNNNNNNNNNISF